MPDGFRFWCASALGLALMVGCSEGGGCQQNEDCTDYNDCTSNVCDVSTGLCAYEAVVNGESCAGGVCQDGRCALTTTRLPCVEQGIRNAIAAGEGPFTFACDGPTTVTTEAEIVIDRDVILDGEGNLVVDGDDRHRVLFVEVVTAELRGLTVTGGKAEGESFDDRNGGGIFNMGFLTLIDCVVSGNAAERYGGGIYNRWRDVSPPNNSTLTIYDSRVIGNTAELGGGISNSGPFTMVNSTVSDNEARQDGGGVYSTYSATMLDTTVSKNTAGQCGGGIAGGLDVLGSLLSANAAQYGAGICIWIRSSIVNSTVSGNSASLRGGGIFTAIGENLEPALIQASIWDNAAPEGAGIFTDGVPESTQRAASSRSGLPTGGATVMIMGSLVQGDCHIEPPAEHISKGHNIEFLEDTCGFYQATDQVKVTAEQLALGPLQDNGGPTMTHALLPGSVAIDWIPAEDCVDADGAPLTTDQRGEPRPVAILGPEPKCDVGAFEAQP